LVALAPDIVLASGTLSVAALQDISRTLPIVFAAVADPVGAGFVDSLARPGGNATGFMIYEYSLGAKWLELLKEIAPSVARAVVRNAANPAGMALFAALQNAAQSFGVELSPINVRDPDEIERLVAAFARSPNGGLIVTQTASRYRGLIITVAARHKLPAVYGLRYDVIGGGLIITLIGGAAAAWPLAARAQQGERMRRIGVLMPPQNCAGLKSRRRCVVPVPLRPCVV
jgi:putative tryptophan/tyrosine transport system substrate-binding protein